MKVSYKWLQSYFKKSLPKPEKLAELFTLRLAEVDGVEENGNDSVFSIDILPDRAHDLLSYNGLAREVGVLANQAPVFPLIPKLSEDTQFKTKDILRVEVKAPSLCPRYSARVMLNIKVASSPTWMVERLEASGIRSINNVVDATNYVMLETGQPLHAFDMEKLRGTDIKSELKHIIVRRAKNEEILVTLDGVRHTLTESMLVIADAKGPIAVAGIMGGAESEISDKTKHIILEAASFDAENIRSTGRTFGLRTESSMRFGAGIESERALFALERVISLIHKNAGGTVTRGAIDISVAGKPATKILFRPSKASSVLGMVLPRTVSIKILKSIGCRVSEKKKGELLVTVPSWRLDIGGEHDLIEEVGRIYGYEHVKPNVPQLKIVPPREDENLVVGDVVRDTLAGLGYSELYSYAFVGEKSISAVGDSSKGYPVLRNPVSADLAYLRASLIPSLLRQAGLNQRFYSDVYFFELGNTYHEANGAFNEKLTLGILCAIKKSYEKNEAFYTLKGVVSYLCEALGIGEPDFREPEDEHAFPAFSPSVVSEIKINGLYAGVIGEAKKEVADAFDAEGHIAITVLDFSVLKEVSTQDTEYKPLSKYPAVMRDVSLLVEFNTKVEDILNVIERVGGELVVDIDLFDVYIGEEIAEGKKNAAFHIVYQSSLRTLSGKEVDTLHGKIVKALETEGWEVR